jgi:hypothetical protein
MQYTLDNSGERDMGIITGQAVWDIMVKLNMADHYSLCVDSGHPDAVYTHLQQTVCALFRQLGIKDMDLACQMLHDTHDFREAVIAGCNPEEYR